MIAIKKTQVLQYVNLPFMLIVSYTLNKCIHLKLLIVQPGNVGKKIEANR
ncbi:MAG: hypothetical protein WDO19_08990 [Bacteroidota bacterium]